MIIVTNLKEFKLNINTTKINLKWVQEVKRKVLSSNGVPSSNLSIFKASTCKSLPLILFFGSKWLLGMDDIFDESKR